MNENIFSGVADIYDKYRPSYPQSLFEYLKNNIGINSLATIADIGSGTGILSKKLVEICKCVYAVEPNDDMRQVAEINLSSAPNFISVSATAEHTTLSAQSIDYITAAQSFHWFNRKNFKKECQRILKSNGKVILIWNCRDEKNEIVQTIDSISRKYCSDFSGSLCGMRGARHANDYNDFFAGDYEVVCFKNPIIFNKERFIGLHQSASYCPNTNEKNYEEYIEALSTYFDAHSKYGLLTLENNTYCYIGSVQEDL